MRTLSAFAALLLGLLAALTTTVFLLAAGANSSAAQIVQLKIMLGATLIVSLASVAGFALALRKGRHRRAAAFGAAPFVFSAALIGFLFAVSW